MGFDLFRKFFKKTFDHKSKEQIYIDPDLFEKTFGKTCKKLSFLGFHSVPLKSGYRYLQRNGDIVTVVKKNHLAFWYGGRYFNFRSFPKYDKAWTAEGRFLPDEDCHFDLIFEIEPDSNLS